MPFNLSRYYKDNEFVILLVSVLAILSVGTLFYSYVEKWTLLNSLYFSVTTLATVGLGDFAPKTDIGKVFTMVYIIIGIGELLAFINMLTQKRKEHIEPARLI